MKKSILILLMATVISGPALAGGIEFRTSFRSNGEGLPGEISAAIGTIFHDIGRAVCGDRIVEERRRARRRVTVEQYHDDGYTRRIIPKRRERHRVRGTVRCRW